MLRGKTSPAKVGNLNRPQTYHQDAVMEEKRSKTLKMLRKLFLN